MTIPSTIPEQIDLIKELEISYRTLHPNAILTDNQTGRIINIPFNSIISKYRNFLDTLIIQIILDEKLQNKYQFKPKLVSNDFYKTTELWDSILILNNAISLFDFKPTVLKLYDPNRLKDAVNEIIVLENIQE